MTPESLLREGLSGWGLAADAAPRLLEFSDRLLEKNRVMNLTAITDPVDVVTLHLLDCAALLRMEDFRGKRVVDVGTGAGFPGMPLRLLEPDFDLTLLDSLGKRVAFLQEVCNAMALQRVTCVHARAEEFAAQERERFDLAVSRAVAPLNVLCELSLPARARGRELPRDEVRRLRRGAAEREERHQPARRAARGLRGLHHPRHRRDAPRRPHPEGQTHAEDLPPRLREDQEKSAEMRDRVWVN